MTVIVLLGLFCMARAEMPDIDIAAIVQIESSGNPMAISQDYCRGLMQISNSVLREYNDYTIKYCLGTYENGFLAQPVAYTKQDLFNSKINIQIGTWYLTERIPQMLRHYKLPVTIDNILIAYNFGIGNLVKYRQGRVGLPTETRNYLKKYYKLAKQ